MAACLIWQVMTVDAYEIVRSDTFQPCGYQLRFPRCDTIRDDKAWHEIESQEELKKRYEEGKAKLAASKRTAEEVASR